MEYSEQLSSTVDGTFNLLTSMMGPYIGYSIGCNTQDYLKSNMILKNILLIFIIFFKVSSASKDSPHPINTFFKSFLIWIVFTSFNRMRGFNTSIVVILFLMLFIIKAYRDHIVKNKPKEKKLNDNLKKAEDMLTIGIVGNIFVGTLIYYNDKVNKFGSEFDITKFIMGIECGSNSQR